MKKLQLHCADCGAEIFQRNNKRAPTFCEACIKIHRTKRVQTWNIAHKDYMNQLRREHRAAIKQPIAEEE
jgi:hypothetical protein